MLGRHGIRVGRGGRVVRGKSRRGDDAALILVVGVGIVIYVVLVCRHGARRQRSDGLCVAAETSFHTPLGLPVGCSCRALFPSSRNLLTRLDPPRGYRLGERMNRAQLQTQVVRQSLGCTMWFRVFSCLKERWRGITGESGGSDRVQGL